MDNQLRTFTVEEANQLIPVLSPLLVQLKKKQDEVLALEAQVDALELVSEEGNKKEIRELRNLVEAHHRGVTDFYSIVNQIHHHGCLLKDVDMGLVDFYSVIEGKVIYLCWRLGEGKVGYWHEIGKGYTFRQPLDVSPNQPFRGEPEGSQ